jgi:F420-dependent oxidoreductase-like protein
MGGDGLPGPTDSWATLAGLAVQTQRIRLGAMVTSATFRLPGPLAITVAQVDAMSGGRVDFALGAGWFETEHRAYGVPFPSTGERFDRLAEQLEIITGLWSTAPGQRFSYRGAHYDVEDSPALPKPVQNPGPPVIIGGRGPRRTPRLAARFADEYNVPFVPLAETRRCFERVAQAAQTEGRDLAGRAPLVFSAAQVTCCGRDDAEVRRRADRIGASVESLREGGLCGSPAEIVEKIGRFGEIGAGRMHLQVLDMADLDHVELLAEVAAQLPG